MEENQDKGGWHPTPDKEATISIRPPLDPESDNWIELHKVSVSKEFGSFEIPISIPENAVFRKYRIEVRDTDSYGGSFTVGDPRPPTVSLTIDSPFWVS